MGINNLDVSRKHREASVNLPDSPVLDAMERTFQILPLAALHPRKQSSLLPGRLKT